MAAAAILCLGIACMRDNAVGTPMADSTVAVSLSVQMPAAAAETRAADTRATADLPAEQIQQLRIVVVSLPTDSKGVPVAGEEPFVEVNALFEAVMFDRFGHRDFMFRDIRSDRYKKLYFLANCEADQSAYLDIRDAAGEPIDITSDAAYLPAANGKAPIEEAIFTAPTGTYAKAFTYENEQRSEQISNYRIPVTAVHDLAVPSVDDLRQMAGVTPQLVYSIEKPLYMVHAVNKINVTLENNTGSSLTNPDGSYRITPTEVRLKSFTISKLSTGKSYLFAHLNENDALFNPYQPTVAEQLRPIYERSNLNPAWMQWLAAEAEKTRNDDNISRYEWLYNYYLPDEITNVATTQTYDGNDNWTSSSFDKAPTKPTAWTSPTVYFPETIYTPNNTDEQEYKITCVFEQRKSATEVAEISYTAVLPNLESLFRNTHVKVNFSVTDNADIYLTLIVQPWSMAPEEQWHYTHTVTVPQEGFIVWSNAANDDTTQCRLLLQTDGEVATGRFTIASPINDQWYAYLIPLTGNPDAFMFVDDNGNEIVTPHGIIDGNPAEIHVRIRHDNVREQNTAKLQIMVQTADNRFLEADVCNGAPTNYTIIQNRNIFE